MTERVFVLLTQDNCPKCERLKKMLAGPLKGAFEEQIEVVHRQEQPQTFLTLAQAHHVQSIPILIHRASHNILTSTGSLGEVQQFLKQEVPN